MTVTTRIQRLRARIDRLPASWVIVLVGFLLQLGLLALAASGGSRLRTVGAAVEVATVVVAGVATIPSVLLLWRGRYRRTAATLAALVATGTLIVSEAYPSLLVYPAALFVAAVRAWAGAGLDAADLLKLDPGRFERVKPSNRDHD